MSGDDIDLGYTRQDLRNATRFLEADYSGINPRQFYRRLKRQLEEIKESGDFKYETEGSQDRHFSIDSEEVGEKTGTVEGRLAAVSDSRHVGYAETEYRPRGPHGALATVVGTLLLLLGLRAGTIIIGLLGIAGMLGGGYLYVKTETLQIPLQRKDILRTLLSGEVSERTIEEDGQSRTDIFANMAVIYAGDTFVTVNLSDEFSELSWVERRETVRQVRQWYNDVIASDPDFEPADRLDVNSGFIYQLTGWGDRSEQSHRETIYGLQGTLIGNFSRRLEYTNVLLDELSSKTRNELEEHQSGLLDELEGLAEEMNVYVDREGAETAS